MSIFDEERRKKPVAHEIGCDISLLSAQELNVRITLLESEIERLKAALIVNATGRLAAENLFKK